MPYVRLKRTWPGPFRRSVRNAKGEVARVLTFAPGEPVEIEGEDLDAIRADLGPALEPLEWDEEAGKFKPLEGEALESVLADARQPEASPGQRKRKAKSETEKAGL